MKRIVLFVEGHGDVDGVPVLAKRVLTSLGAWQHLGLHPDAFRVQGAASLMAKSFEKWQRYVAVALKIKDVGGILLVLDGDLQTFLNKPFCAWRAANAFAEAARARGAGKHFSVAVVFARQEFESWLIAGVQSLAGRKLASGSVGVKPHVVSPTSELEETPRDAKGWLSGMMKEPYSPTIHQGELSRLVDLAEIRGRPMRSFLRFESALCQLTEAIRDDRHVATPGAPSL